MEYAGILQVTVDAPWQKGGVKDTVDSRLKSSSRLTLVAAIVSLKNWRGNRGGFTPETKSPTRVVVCLYGKRTFEIAGRSSALSRSKLSPWRMGRMAGERVCVAREIEPGIQRSLGEWAQDSSLSKMVPQRMGIDARTTLEVRARPTDEEETLNQQAKAMPFHHKHHMLTQYSINTSNSKKEYGHSPGFQCLIVTKSKVMAFSSWTFCVPRLHLQVSIRSLVSRELSPIKKRDHPVSVTPFLPQMRQRVRDISCSFPSTGGPCHKSAAAVHPLFSKQTSRLSVIQQYLLNIGFLPN